MTYVFIPCSVGTIETYLSVAFELLHFSSETHLLFSRWSNILASEQNWLPTPEAALHFSELKAVHEAGLHYVRRTIAVSANDIWTVRGLLFSCCLLSQCCIIPVHMTVVIVSASQAPSYNRKWGQLSGGWIRESPTIVVGPFIGSSLC